MIITIDGPAGTGKSTTARKVAEEMSYCLLDTGAMYRAITWGVIHYNIAHQDPQALQKFLQEHPLKLTSRFGERRYFLNSEDVSEHIRSPEVTALVSQISAYPIVREALVPIQRQSVQGMNAVCEGRDMGTTVFPKANLKIFLTANLDTRAQRRFSELKQNGKLSPTDTLESIKVNINKRDEFDAAREHSPMKPAEDAILIDTSALTLQQVVDQIIILTEQRSD